ncbi:MAG TPA: DUF3221 domain-containing protein [Coriobacteriia bacterium]|nr:DUF3221 domain-containing protein [Coriobacteriia bacterium]
MSVPSALRRVVLVLLVAVALGSAGCAARVPPETEPTIRGVITQITPGQEAGGLILVVWHDSLGEQYELDSISARVEETTDVFDRDGNAIEFADLEVRDVVDLWVTGPIAESYPPQGGADAVRVVGRFDDIRPLPIPPGLVAP